MPLNNKAATSSKVIAVYKKFTDKSSINIFSRRKYVPTLIISFRFYEARSSVLEISKNVRIASEVTVKPSDFPQHKRFPRNFVKKS